MSVNGWKPMSSAPRDGTTIIGFLSNEYRDPPIMFARWDLETEVWYDAHTGEWGKELRPIMWIDVPILPNGDIA